MADHAGLCCPKCGGQKLKLIASSSYECLSFDSDAYICHARFQIADDVRTSTETCDCGTFAIGRCVECDRSVCGEHSELVGGRRLCERHAQIAWEGEQRRKDDEWSTAQGRFEQECLEALDIFVRAMNAAGNPGCRGTYLIETRKGKRKSTKVSGWQIRGDAFILPDGALYIAPHERWGGGGRFGPRVLLERRPEEWVRDAARAGWFVGWFKDHASRSGDGPFSPIDRLQGFLLDGGLQWPAGYTPPTDTPDRLRKQIYG
jgi:hypothetical protein